MFDDDTLLSIKTEVYFLANHLAIPRNGSTVFLRNAYAEEDPDIPFAEYQQGLMFVLYQQLQEYIPTGALSSSTD